MGNYYRCLNNIQGLERYQEVVNSPYFVDKSLLISIINKKIATVGKCVCVSRPRRFGKSTNLAMLAAYYTKGINSEPLFSELEIAQADNFKEHLNKHNVILLNFNDYFEESLNVEEGIRELIEEVVEDLSDKYPEVRIDTSKSLDRIFDKIYGITGEKFIFLIDEWDCVFRFMKGKEEEQYKFLSFIRRLFKDRAYVELVYMTGILPIKKYSTGSALNMFEEYTVLQPRELGKYLGFTEEEVLNLCNKQGEIEKEKLKEWYNGYYIKGVGAIYNPRSIVSALTSNWIENYWTGTGGFDELREYITLNFDGLRECVIELLEGKEIIISTLGFSNDLDSFEDKDEVLTALIHLGYLTFEDDAVRIPNKEIGEEFDKAIQKASWGQVSKMLAKSKQLLRSTLKGSADAIFYPRRVGDTAFILELKYGQTPQEAIKQIKEKKYYQKLEYHTGKILAVGINYDKKTKKHECIIEEITNLLSNK